MTNNQSSIREGIQTVLEENNGEVQGTAHLADQLKTDEHWLRKCARVLAHAGLITIIPSRGGRGKRTIYKRNPNSTGLPRKVRKP
jgi:predicted transcriptional regulator